MKGPWKCGSLVKKAMKASWSCRRTDRLHRLNLDVLELGEAKHRPCAADQVGKLESRVQDFTLPADFRCGHDFSLSSRMACSIRFPTVSRQSTLCQSRARHYWPLDLGTPRSVDLIAATEVEVGDRVGAQAPDQDAPALPPLVERGQFLRLLVGTDLLLTLRAVRRDSVKTALRVLAILNHHRTTMAACIW